MHPLFTALLAASCLVKPIHASPIIDATAGAGGDSSRLTDWEQISNVINLYPLAVDFNKTHELFPQVFAPNAFANYTSDVGNRQDLHGLKNITDTFAPDGLHFDAQHLFGSIRIEFSKDSANKANATSYALTTAFGRGPYYGQQATFYGIYRDTFERINGLGWRITVRYYNQQGPAAGNTSLLKGP